MRSKQPFRFVIAVLLVCHRSPFSLSKQSFWFVIGVLLVCQSSLFSLSSQPFWFVIAVFLLIQSSLFARQKHCFEKLVAMLLLDENTTDILLQFVLSCDNPKLPLGFKMQILIPNWSLNNGHGVLRLQPHGGWSLYRAALRAQRATLPGQLQRYLGRRSWSFYVCGGCCWV